MSNIIRLPKSKAEDNNVLGSAVAPAAPHLTPLDHSHMTWAQSNTTSLLAWASTYSLILPYYPRVWLAEQLLALSIDFGCHKWLIVLLNCRHSDYALLHRIYRFRSMLMLYSLQHSAQLAETSTNAKRFLNECLGRLNSLSLNKRKYNASNSSVTISSVRGPDAALLRRHIIGRRAQATHNLHTEPHT